MTCRRLKLMLKLMLKLERQRRGFCLTPELLPISRSVVRDSADGIARGILLLGLKPRKAVTAGNRHGFLEFYPIT